MLTNWSLSGPDDNGHIWINTDHPDGTKSGHNLGPEDDKSALLGRALFLILEQSSYRGGSLSGWPDGQNETIIAAECNLGTVATELLAVAEALRALQAFSEQPTVHG